MTHRVPPSTFASCWDGNWSFEAMFTQRHFSQALHNIGWMDSHSSAHKVCSNILARGFSLNVKTLQIRNLNFWSDQKIHLISFFQTSCIKSTQQIVQIHLKSRSLSAHLSSINDYVIHPFIKILYCVPDMCNTLYISVENKVILYASKFAPITFFITLHCNYFEFKYTVYDTYL